MDLKLISSVLIYAAMFICIYICINPRRLGLVQLYRLSRDLANAASMLADKQYCRKLESQIRGGALAAASDLFTTTSLAEQMEQYCDNIYYMELNPSDKCRIDIDEYINHSLLHHQGRVSLCEHTASGLTALGLLGTFLGMAFGLTSFSKNHSEEIINGISGLFEGMDLAFLTSIWGIILSLALGTALRIVLSSAESNLELFLERFRSNVMRNQSEAALNEIIKHIISIESGLNTANEIQVSTLNKTANEFAVKLNNILGKQISFLQSSIEDMSKEQRAHAESIKTLTAEMNGMSNMLQNVNNSFHPVLTQSSKLSEHIRSANEALKDGVSEIQNLLSSDADALSMHQKTAGDLRSTCETLKKLTDSVQKQAADSAAHYEELYNNQQLASSAALAQFAQTAKTLNNEVHAHSLDKMNALQNHADALLCRMPNSGISDATVSKLIGQNNAILDQQQQLIHLMEESLRNTKHASWIRRKRR